MFAMVMERIGLRNIWEGMTRHIVTGLRRNVGRHTRLQVGPSLSYRWGIRAWGGSWFKKFFIGAAREFGSKN